MLADTHARKSLRAECTPILWSVEALESSISRLTNYQLVGAISKLVNIFLRMTAW